MTNEEKRKQLEKLGKIIVGGIVCLIVGPFALAILGFLPAILAVSAIIAFQPYLALKFANWRLKAIKAEASKNPVETLQNDFYKQKDQLVKRRENLKLLSAEVENFAGEIETLRVTSPNDVPKFEAALTKMRQLYALRERKYEQVQRGLDAYDKEIQRIDAVWKVSQAANRAGEVAGAEEDFLQQIACDAALDSVKKNLNMAFAELDVSLVDEKHAQQLSAQAEPLQVADRPQTVNQYLHTAELVNAK